MALDDIVVGASTGSLTALGAGSQAFILEFSSTALNSPIDIVFDSAWQYPVFELPLKTSGVGGGETSSIFIN